jgi:hypothetical protein
MRDPLLQDDLRDHFVDTRSAAPGLSQAGFFDAA